MATAPAVGSFRSQFIAGGASGFGEAAAGDHLQSVYRFWLFGHQLEHGEPPWRDPYSFQPLVDEQLVLAGWPFGLPFWPLDALFGPVVAWNFLLLAVITLAGFATYGWLRTLALSPTAAAIGGLVFAIAPYRLAQSSGHLLGWIAVFVPLTLLAYERARTATTERRRNGWGVAAAAFLVTVPLSGQIHLALGVLPFCLVYAALRFERRAALWLGAGTLAAVAVGTLLRATVIADSIASGGRTLDQVESFQADWLDLISRFRLEDLEQFVYVGWLTPALAVAGLVLLWRRNRGLTVLLGVAVLVPLLLAVGTNIPVYEFLWRYVPPFRFPRVPARLVPIADLALAALAAVAVAAVLDRVRATRRVLVGAGIALLLAADLLVLPFRATPADPGNAAYAALGAEPVQRTLELPIFEPGIHFGSVYDYYGLQSAHERPSGYSTLAPLPPYTFFWAMNRLNCGVLLPSDVPELERLGVTHLLFHAGAYEQASRPGAWFAWQALQKGGYRPVAQGGEIWLFPLAPAPGSPPVPAPLPEPDRPGPVLCEAWRGWTMKQRNAPLWVYGNGAVELELAAPEPATGFVSVDGGRFERFEVDGTVTLVVGLEEEGWHSVLFRIEQLFETQPPQGFELVRLTFRNGEGEG